MRSLCLAIAGSVALLTAQPASADLTSTMISHVGAKRPAHCPPRLWCACGLSVYLKRKGMQPLPSYRARDAAQYGSKASGFKRGNIIVFRNHVGVATGKMCSGGKVEIVSANHNNRVGVGCYSVKRVIAVRRAGR